MLKALVNKELVNAKNVESGTIGKCPFCENDVRARCGEININHWAHIDNECTYISEADNEWHTAWKNKSEKKGYETEKEFGKFIADAYNPKTNTVTEFQHSSITPQEIRDRCNHYKNMNVNIKWVFDYTDKYKKQHIKLIEKIGDDNVLYYTFKISYQKRGYIQGVSYHTFDESLKLSVPVYLNIIHNYDDKNYTQLRVNKNFDEYRNDMYNNSRYKNYIDNLNNSIYNFGDKVTFNDNDVLAEIKYDINRDVLLEVRTIYEKGKRGWGNLLFV